MDTEERIDLIKREPTEEIVTDKELYNLLSTNSHPKHYIGLEISGKLHLGSLIITGYKLRDFIRANISTTVFLADWHTYINNKLGGDWDKIKRVSNYYRDAFEFFCPGVRVILGSDIYDNNDDYWKNLIRFCKNITMPRVTRSLTIMGRSEKDNLDFSQFIYPPMQAVDIKMLDLDIVHAGMDQRKIHMMIREVFPKMGWKIPVSVHHHLLPGLSEPSSEASIESKNNRQFSKMSKSNTSSSITIHDDQKTISNKINKAYCIEGDIQYNPILEMCKYIIFHDIKDFEIERPSKYGGSITYDNYKKLEEDFYTKKLHPKDLKISVAREIDNILKPIRDYIENKQYELF